jgi:hypothetical protein
MVEGKQLCVPFLGFKLDKKREIKPLSNLPLQNVIYFYSAETSNSTLPITSLCKLMIAV